jgi:multidrug efflux pump subunit AcrA (membrane-fusion protein)
MQVIEQERRKLSRRLDEVSRLCEADVPPSTFYGEMLKRLLESLAAPAGAVWTRTPQGNLQLQFQINLREVGLDKSEEARQSHEELLRSAVMNPGPQHLLPHSGVGQPAQEGKAPAGNPTDFLLLLVPIMLGADQVGGLIEIWQSPNRPLNAVPGFLQYMALMADLCTRYQRHQMLGQMTGQQQVWTQLETFSKTIHSSLNPVEVAYHIANEGRRLVECDRISVALRYARKPRVEAISGADVVERRSNLVQLMQALCFEVMKWGEKLVFTGTKDETLPPKVLDALNKYLEESASKLLVILPLRDDREKESKRLPRSALMMESFEPPAEPQQLVARLDVIGKHATSALYNAVEHRRIPMRYLWMPLARLQEGLGGKGQAIAMCIAVALTLFIAVMVFVPYPLKMDSEGKLVPVARRYVYYGGGNGRVISFHVDPGERVVPGQRLVTVHDIDQTKKLEDLRNDMNRMRREATSLRTQASAITDLSSQVRQEKIQQADQLEAQARDKEDELNDQMRHLGARDNGPGKEFTFNVQAPPFNAEELQLLRGNRLEWTVLNTDNFKETLLDRTVRPSDPILHLGAKSGPWELELKIPQKHIGQVLMAYKRENTNELDVDFLVSSDKTRVFRGRLARDKIAGEAKAQQDETASSNNEAEPMVTCYVRIAGEGIPEDKQVPPELLLSGIEVHAKVRCGERPMGYSLFYGVWEFLFEKVVFFF